MVRPADYIHPEDEAARRNMEAIPGFAAAMKLFMRYYDEQIVHGMNMANKIRLSPTQLPEIYQKLPPICQRLSISEPEFYLEMDPYPNAYAMGDTRTMVTVTSGLLEYLTDEEVSSVIAHECGHIACRHMLYHTLSYPEEWKVSRIMYSSTAKVCRSKAVRTFKLSQPVSSKISCTVRSDGRMRWPISFLARSLNFRYRISAHTRIYI